MTINHSIRDWVSLKQAEFPSIAALPVVIMGDRGDLDPPFLAIYETGAELVEQNGVILHGVSAYSVKCDLVTVPAETADEGTPAATQRKMTIDLMNIIGNRDCITWASERNGWRIFDIRGPGFTQEASDGQLTSTFEMTVIACPI